MDPTSIQNHPRLHLRALVAGFLFLASLLNASALSLNPPERFFTNVADRLLHQQLGLRLREIQVAPTNQYDSAVHRIFQVTANIYDATTTNELPSVFRPLFETRSNGVFLAGFTNDHRVSTLAGWLEGNTNGLPLVIGAKKGLPNFNEFTLRSDILVQRKLQVTRPNTNRGTRPNGTNQMYVLGISNYFGVEAWNSYNFSRSGPYPRPTTITVSNFATLVMSNALGIQTNTTLSSATATNIPAGTWRGGETIGFILPLNTNTVFLSNAVYRFDENVFANAATNSFEQTPTGFPLPYWVYFISNRLTYLMSEPDGNDERIVDFVILQENQTVDLFRDIIAGNPYQYLNGVSAAVRNLWNTNRTRGPLGPTDGILQQMDIALGNIPTPNSEWRDFALAGTASENEKQRRIDAFRYFLGFSPLSTNQFATNLTTAMDNPFNPAAKLSVLSTSQANDPSVHYHVTDLRLAGALANRQYLKPSQPATNLPPSSLGRLNDKYSPWGGNPLKSFDPYPFRRDMKDAGVYTSDDWNFPIGEMLSSDWLGRVHRGTPWQTVYLKNEAAPLSDWTNQSPDMVRLTNGNWFSRTHPTNDWRMAAWFAEMLNTNDVRALPSVNTTNFNAWADLLTGLTVLSNNQSTPQLGQPPRFETNIIAPGAPQIPFIVDGINQTRTGTRGQYFDGVAAFLSVPELSTASPWLNLTGDQAKWGLTDEAYEILPSQLLSLVRADPVGTVTFSTGSLELRFTTIDGSAYQVEGSSDFMTWETVSGPHYGTDGAFTLSLPASADWKFFRAVSLP